MITAAGLEETSKEVKEEEAHVSCLCESKCHPGDEDVFGGQTEQLSSFWLRFFYPGCSNIVLSQDSM